MFSLFLFAWQACALHNPTHGNVYPNGGAEGDMLEVHSQLPIANGLAGCKSGNFAAKGGDKCTGIQTLRCNEDGSCAGTLQGNTYKINCNAKHECVTDSWGGTMVRKYFSTTGRVGAVDWNNGCSWVCEDEGALGTHVETCAFKWEQTKIDGLKRQGAQEKENYCRNFWTINDRGESGRIDDGYDAQYCHYVVTRPEDKIEDHCNSWKAMDKSAKKYRTQCPTQKEAQEAVASQCKTQKKDRCRPWNYNEDELRCCKNHKDHKIGTAYHDTCRDKARSNYGMKVKQTTQDCQCFER